LSKATQEIVCQDLNAAPREREVINLDVEEPQLPLTQPTSQECLFQEWLEEWLAEREIAGPQQPDQCARTMPKFGQPGLDPRYPILLIFPPLVPRTPSRPIL
jgi:hypothetical protein